MRAISVIWPGSRAGIENGEQAQQHLRLERGPAFDADRIGEAAGEFDMGRAGKRVRSPIQRKWAEEA